MQRLISLFASIQHEPQLSQPASGPPPGPEPDYRQDPEYFQHLLAYLREQRQSDETDEDESTEAAELQLIGN